MLNWQQLIKSLSMFKSDSRWQLSTARLLLAKMVNTSKLVYFWMYAFQGQCKYYKILVRVVECIPAKPCRDCQLSTTKFYIKSWHSWINVIIHNNVMLNLNLNKVKSSSYYSINEKWVFKNLLPTLLCW